MTRADPADERAVNAVTWTVSGLDDGSVDVSLTSVGGGGRV
jgi:hypothetical protein